MRVGRNGAGKTDTLRHIVVVVASWKYFFLLLSDDRYEGMNQRMGGMRMDDRYERGYNDAR